MADYNDIKQSIATNLPDNNKREITASKLRDTLNKFVNKVENTETRIEDNVSEINTKIAGLRKEGIYDVTANNNGVTFASLSALLSDENLSTLIPDGVRGGGMNIRFVQSSDNKYVQYILTKDEWSISEGDWEKMNIEEEVDGKIDKTIMQETQEEIQNDHILKDSYIKGYGNGDIGTLNNFKVFRFPVVGGQRYLLTGLKVTSDSVGFAIFHTSGGDDNANKIAGSYYSSYGDENPAVDREVTAPENAAYLYVQKGNTVDSVVPKCVHVYSETINAEANVLAIGDTTQLGGTIVDNIVDQGKKAQLMNDILMLNALSGGMKLRSYNKKHQFSWSFPKPIVSIKIDDLHPSVDLAVKIAKEIGINVVLGAPASNLGVVVTGITDPSEKIGNTALDVCQYLYAQGGEIAEHTTSTFTDESQIKEFFIDQKLTFLKNGIILRGAAVANAFPSDELKDKLEPYLRYYYDYSNGYGKEIPYNTSGNLVRSHTYGTSNFTTPTEVLAVVDTWKTFSEKGWHTITFHAVGGTSSGDYHITEDDYRTILTGIKGRADNGDFKLMIWSEVYDAYGMYN